MTILTVTAKGQVTLRKELLQHLGITQGQKIEVLPLPDGRLEVRAAQPGGSIEGFIGLPAGRSPKVATLQEINEAAAQGWAGRK